MTQLEIDTKTFDMAQHTDLLDTTKNTYSDTSLKIAYRVIGICFKLSKIPDFAIAPDLPKRETYLKTIYIFIIEK